MALKPEEIQSMAESYAAAWSSGDSARVASHYEDSGTIAINDGDPIEGRAAVQQMVEDFYAQVPGLTVRLDVKFAIKTAGDNAVFHWTLEGTHAETGKTMQISGWEEWALSPSCKVQTSRGRFDPDEYDRQVREGV